MKMKLESDSLLQDVWVRGEISNFTNHSSGHLYFTMKDEGGRIKCVMFARQRQSLPFMPKEGMKVLARGNISVFERDGQYQLYVTQMQPDGIGSLYLAFEQLKKRLEAEGLFRPERKRPLPRFPKAVGVITSPTGAAVRDIMTTLQRRYPAVPIILFPVLVQGTQAPASIVRAIRIMNELAEAEVLIVGRGGGSLEELWAFNEEEVARAIAASAIPVISAVGHETDFTIADFVADLRAATPTAAAELAVPHFHEVRQGLRHLTERLQQGLYAQLSRKQERLRRAAHSPIFRQPHAMLQQPAQRLDRLSEQLRLRMEALLRRSNERWIRIDRRLAARDPGSQLTAAKQRLSIAQLQLVKSAKQYAKDRRTQLGSTLRQLDALSPLKIMQRGYSIVYDEKKSKLIRSVEDVQLGDLVKVQLRDGQLDCQVWSMKGEE
ncbi:exodeoxyribonuclease VII large subunit [Paenibacillus turpanensis]|uniref:exodeoxyribonuclease VII large subunit n=1 Tax=Paenibacillus turpanensis TaxID=2689078 RepID=UPI001A9ED327